jgi:hypothetical protein
VNIKGNEAILHFPQVAVDAGVRLDFQQNEPVQAGGYEF